MKKNLFLLCGIAGVFLFLVGFVFAANSFSGSQTSGFGGLTATQYYQPSFNTYYTSDQIGTYWPILNDMKNGQCQASNDFLVAIPPLGCTPSVVRSDLLDDQNVPVFCQLDALQVNPLIKVSSIQSINFAGTYPSNVAGISFHPARAAVNTRETLLGSPLLNNIGYVVIILKRTAAEKNMTDFVKGNLTATITYDAEKAFGVGSAQFLLPVISEDNWAQEFEGYGFWNGKGYARLLSTDGVNAVVGLYTDQSRLFQKINLKVGETSNEIYFPGLYCNAGLQVRLNSLDAAVNKVKLSVDGDEVWAGVGTSFLNGKCKVTNLFASADGTGTVSISCTGNSKFDLTLSRQGADFNGKTISVGKLVSKDAADPKKDLYLAYVGNLSDKITSSADNEKQFAILYQSSKELDGTFLAKVAAAVNKYGSSATQLSFTQFSKYISDSLGAKATQIYSKGLNGFNGIAEKAEETTFANSNIEDNFTAAYDSLGKLLESYGDEKDLAGNYYGEKALWLYADSAKSLGKLESRKAALQMLIDKYPDSSSAGQAKTELRLINGFDITNAGKGVYVNNQNYYIFAEDFKQVSSDEKNVDLSVGDKLVEGDEVCIDGTGNNALGKKISSTCSFIRVQKINSAYVTLAFSEYDLQKTRYITSNKSIRLYEDSSLGENSQILAGRNVYVRNINVVEEASISIIPRVENTKTQANFTFNIGIEKRSIQLSPEKTTQMIANLNKSISDWQNRVDKLGNLVSAWKGACLATSAFMVMSNFASGLDGQSIARKNVMDKYKLICDQEIGQKTYSSRTECYNAKSKEIDAAVQTGTTSISQFNAEVKDLENKALMSDGKTINQTKLKDLMDAKYGVTNSQYLTTEQLKDYLFWQDQAKGTDATLVAQAKLNIAQLNQQAAKTAADDKLEESGVFDVSKDKRELISFRSGTAVTAMENKLRAANLVSGTQKVQVMQGSDSQTYAVVLDKETPESDRYKPIGVYLNGEGSNLVSSASTSSVNNQGASQRAVLEISNNYRFVESSCKGNKYLNPIVKYYSSSPNSFLPSLVPFDSKNGWYVKVSQSGSGVLSSTVQSYQASGAVQYYTICNVGPNGNEENGVGDDICQGFSANNNVNIFGGCTGLTQSDVTNLKNQALSAIQQASSQYGKTKIAIGKESFNSMLSAGDNAGLECQDFMSPDQCKLLFNVCDPVICPSSRCNLGGKYPVADVVQSGVIGSLLLCLPNMKEGVAVPICLTGVHAGLDAYLSILKSEKSCLQENLDSGKSVGICDEITSVYKCEFFWNQIAPIVSNLIPAAVDYVYNGGSSSAARGGAEYLSTQAAWTNMQASIDYFKNSYAQNSFNAFKFKNIQEVGSEFCRASIGTSVPTSASLADGLLAPESPSQFYANFDETTFTQATVPATSQYKVYYHIYAGNDQGANYLVYLQSPPDSAYYHSNPTVTVKTGYVTKGNSADETVDFTAPSGYKELCVMINAKTECGFKTVSTSLASNYLTNSYVANQANQSSITSEKECISGTPSVLALATSPNVQAGAQGAINPDVSLKGIVRVCATTNPGKGTNPERWTNVGNCGSETMNCWLDRNSVNDTVSKVNAINGALTTSVGTTNDLAANTKQTLEETVTELTSVEKSINEWTIKDDMQPILTRLDAVINNRPSNSYVAEALSLKVSFYLRVVNLINDRTIKSDSQAVVASGNDNLDGAIVSPSGESYITQEGETLATIAKSKGVSKEDLFNSNSVILTGDKITLANAANQVIPTGTQLIIPTTTVG